MKNPPVDYLLLCAGISLDEFELNRLNQVANLRKQKEELEYALQDALAEAMLARWLMEHRQDLLAGGRVRTIEQSFEFVSIAEVQPAPARIGPRKTASRKQLKEVVA